MSESIYECTLTGIMTKNCSKCNEIKENIAKGKHEFKMAICYITNNTRETVIFDKKTSIDILYFEIIRIL